MREIKITELFLCLLPKERREFKFFLENDILKKERKKRSLFLFNELEKLYRSQKCGKEGLKKMTTSDLEKNIYCKENISPNEIHKRFNALLEQIKQYLLFKRINNDENIKEQLELSIYKERNLNNLALLLASNKISNLEGENRNWLNAKEHKKLAFLKNYVYTYPQTDQNKKKQSTLDDIQHHYIMSHTLAMLRLCCSQLMRAKEYKSGENTCFINTTFAITDLYEAKENDLVKLYIQAISTLENPTDEKYQILKRMFDDNKIYLSEETQGDILLYLFTVAYLLSTKSVCNHCYIEACYNLLQEIFSKKIFLKNGYLNADLFISYIVICGEYQQIVSNTQTDLSDSAPINLDELIKEYTPYLSNEDQNLIKDLAATIKHYYHKEYKQCFEKANDYLQPKNPKSEKAKENPNKYNYKREADSLYVRSLRLRAYFEYGDIDEGINKDEDIDKDMKNHLQAFKRFLKRNENIFSKKQVIVNRNLIKLTKKILSVRNKKITYRKRELQKVKEQLMNEINTCELIVCRNWLQRQVSNL